MNFKVVIPARFESTRFPGKLLSTINGQTIINHVINVAQRSGASEVIVATDDERIAQSVKNPECEVIMTSTNHQSGTDRIAEKEEKKRRFLILDFKLFHGFLTICFYSKSIYTVI